MIQKPDDMEDLYQRMAEILEARKASNYMKNNGIHIDSIDRYKSEYDINGDLKDLYNSYSDYTKKLKEKVGHFYPVTLPVSVTRRAIHATEEKIVRDAVKVFNQTIPTPGINFDPRAVYSASSILRRATFWDLNWNWFGSNTFNVTARISSPDGKVEEIPEIKVAGSLKLKKSADRIIQCVIERVYFPTTSRNGSEMTLHEII